MSRDKRERTNLHARVAIETAEKVKQIAFNLGYIHGGEGSIGQLLDAIADGEIKLSPTDATETNYKTQELEIWIRKIVSEEISKLQDTK